VSAPGTCSCNSQQWSVSLQAPTVFNSHLTTNTLRPHHRTEEHGPWVMTNSCYGYVHGDIT
jgi:hypothetical protein